MKWVLDKNKTLSVIKDWERLPLSTYDTYELFKKSRKLRYDYYHKLPNIYNYTLVLINLNDPLDKIHIDKYTDSKREYMVVTHFQIMQSIPVIVSRQFYRTETSFEEQRRKESHSSYVIDSSKSDPEFDNPAWGDYIKGE